MPSNSKNKKRKNKPKQSSKKGSQHISPGNINVSTDATLLNKDAEYPTSRVIRRASNGDVVVESLDVENPKKDSKKNGMDNNALAVELDSHWGSLDSTQKKEILRINKDEIFEIIKNYQNKHTCNCSVCGRRNLTIDDEMERIYDTLFSMSKEQDPNMNPIKFHLSIIRELQNPKSEDLSFNPISKLSYCKNDKDHIIDDDSRKQENTPINDNQEVPSHKNDIFPSSKLADSLKEEVMHFKEQKQKQVNNSLQQITKHTKIPPYTSEKSTNDINNFITSKIFDDESLKHVKEEVYQQYMDFTKSFISSHPKIAQEYVKKMLQYPEMRSVTADLMINRTDNFLKSLETYLLQDPFLTKLSHATQNNKDEEEEEEQQANNDYIDAENNEHDIITEMKIKEILNSQNPLTPEEYAGLLRHVAIKVIDSYDIQKQTFKKLSALQHGLFVRFMCGESREIFCQILMNVFHDKYSNDISITATGLSIAAAAATEINHTFISDNIEDVDSNNKMLDQYSEMYENDECKENYTHDVDISDNDHYIYSDYEDEGIPPLPDFDHNDHEPSLLNYDQPSYSHNDHKAFNMDRSSSFTNSEENFSDNEHHHYDDNTFEDNDEIGENDYDSEIDESERLEEGRKLIQIAITKLLQHRIIESFHEKQAENNRTKLLEELEAENQKKKVKEEKKQKKREKEKEKKKLQQQAREEEKRKKEEERIRSEKEALEREMKRREEQRKKAEEAKRKKDEEKRKKLEIQRKREEEQEQQRKIREEQKRKREEEQKRKKEEEEEKRKKEELQKQKEKKEREEKRMKEETEKQRLEKEELEKKKLEQESQNKVKYSNINNETSTPIPITNQLMDPLNAPYSKQDSLSKSINDDLFDMINKVATSNSSVPQSVSNLQNLLSFNPGLQNNTNQTTQLLNNTSNFPFESNSAHSQLFFDYRNNPTLQQPSRVSNFTTSTSNIIPPQTESSNTWNNSVVDSRISTSSEVGKQLSPKLASYNANHNDNSRKTSFVNELDNLTNSLMKSNLDSGNVGSPHKQFNGGVWDKQPVQNLNNYSLGLNDMSLNSSIGMQTSPNIPPQQFWGTGKSTDNNLSSNIGLGHPTTDVDTSKTNTTLSQPNSTNGFTHTSIWNNEQVPIGKNSFMLPSWNTSNPSTMGSLSNDPIQIKDQVGEVINRQLTTLQIQDGSFGFIPVDTLFQNCIQLGLDYNSFIIKIASIAPIYNYEFLNTETGAITHVKQNGGGTRKSIGTSQPTSISNSYVDHNDIYLSNASLLATSGLASSSNNSGIQSQGTSPSTRGGTSFSGSQMMDISSSSLHNSSALRSNIWS